MQKLFWPNLTDYRFVDLRRDVIAALVVTGLAIPESLGFAALLGLPVETGLYTALIAPVVYGLLASSRRLVVGADSATAALIATGVGALAVVGSADYVSQVTTVTLMAGVLVVAMGLLKFGFLADLISRPVLVGFFGGVGIQLIFSKLPEILGLDASGNVIAKLGYVLSNLSDINLPTFGIALLVFFALWVGKRLKLPGALLGLGVALVLSEFFTLGLYGVETIGSITSHLPELILPTWSLAIGVELFPLALSIALVILAQSTATARAFGARHDEEVDDNRDLVALGFANISAAFTQGFSVNGSPPRSAAAEQSGGTSQLVNIFMSGYIALTLLFATDLLQRIPAAALAAIIIGVGFHLINIPAMKHILRTNRTEFLIALVALLGVALLGVRQGIFIAIIASLAERLRREYRPKDRVLVRDEKIDDWARERIDTQHHRYRSSPPGLLVYRFDGAVFFENANYFSKRLLDAVSEAKEPVHNVVIDAGSITDIDYTGAEAIRRAHDLLATDDTQLTLAHVSPGLVKELSQYGLVKLIGKKHIFPTLNEAIKSHPSSARSAIDMVKRLELSRNSYVVIGGGVLEALGLRSTYDIDMVVNEDTYKYFVGKGWSEIVEDSGKHMLSHNGYKLMMEWSGMDLARLRQNAFQQDGVWFMGIEDLMKVKAKLGRRKDEKDIEMLKGYLAKVKSNTSQKEND